MRTIRISDEVWDKIAERGVFGETPDDVLRRVFGIKDTASIATQTGKKRQRYATNRMTPKITNGVFSLEFEDGASREFNLPPKHDKGALRDVLEDALSFANRNNATEGQLQYVRKALTDNGYHLTK
ncbi:MAG: hypothetical protein HOC20_09650 [Chloroflexi bacterium]|jgi:negative regulator of replication initiation|nr:hypothetical protein [Chloroflexota bacterium]